MLFHDSLYRDESTSINLRGVMANVSGIANKLWTPRLHNCRRIAARCHGPSPKYRSKSHQASGSSETFSSIGRRIFISVRSQSFYLIIGMSFATTTINAALEHTPNATFEFTGSRDGGVCRCTKTKATKKNKTLLLFLLLPQQIDGSSQEERDEA